MEAGPTGQRQPPVQYPVVVAQRSCFGYAMSQYLHMEGMTVMESLSKWSPATAAPVSQEIVAYSYVISLYSNYKIITMLAVRIVQI